jgi:hypothetical protein
MDAKKKDDQDGHSASELHKAKSLGRGPNSSSASGTSQTPASEQDVEPSSDSGRSPYCWSSYGRSIGISNSKQVAFPPSSSE